MIENPKTLTEQLLNLVERIATEMKALFATIETKQDAGDYATNEALTSGLAGKANTAHSHEISAVNGLQTALDSKQAAGDYLTKTTADSYYLGKSEKATSAGTADTATKATQDASGNVIAETYATKTELAGKQPTGDYLTTSAASAAYAPKSHTHTTADVSGLDTALAGKADASHTHEISAVNGLQTALDSKQPAGSYSVTGHTHMKSEITDFPALATVATSGSYNDLSDKPTIPEPVDVSGLIPKAGDRGQLVGYENVATVNTANGGLNITMRANGIKYCYGDNGIETEQELPDVVDLDTGGGGISIGVADTASLISATKVIRVATPCGSFMSGSHVVWTSGSAPVVEPPFMLVLHFQTGTCLAQYHSLAAS